MNFKYGYHSVNGVFIIDKRYLKIGDENKNIPDVFYRETERHKRIELMGLPISFSNGCLFELWYPDRNITSSEELPLKSQGIKEFLKTCSIAS